MAKVTSFQAEEDSIKKVSKFAEDHHLQLNTDHSDANQQDCSPLEFVPPKLSKNRGSERVVRSPRKSWDKPDLNDSNKARQSNVSKQTITTQFNQPHPTTEYRNKVTKMTRVMRCVIKENGKTAQQEDYEVKFFQN